MAGSSTNTGTLTAGFKADAALSEIASSFSIHVSNSYYKLVEWKKQVTIIYMVSV